VISLTALAAHLCSYLPIALCSLAAFWLCACTLAISLRLTRWLVPGVGLALRWSSCCGIGMWLATVGFHVLRSLDAFTLPAALLICALLLGVTQYAFPARPTLIWAVRRECRALRRVGRLFRRSEHRLVLGLFAGIGALLALRSLLIPPLGWDGLTYHGPRAALWLQSSQLTFDPGPGPYSVYRHFFAGGELLMAWAMLPFHSDLFANLALVVQWIGLGLATWALARAMGLREPAGWTSAVVVMFVPTVQFELGSGYVELALNAALLLGVALAIHGLRRFSAKLCVVAAMAIGVAVGIKLTAAPPAAIIASILVLRLLTQRDFSWSRRLGYLAVSSACALLPALPWLLSAWRDTGYPLSPMPVSIFGFELGVASPALRWLQTRPGLMAYDGPTERAALLRLFSPIHHFNESFGVLASIPLLVFPFGLVVLARRRFATALILVAVAAAPVAVHFSPGMSLNRLLWPVSAARYMIASLAIIVPISLAVCTTQGWLARGYRWSLLIYPLSYSYLGLQYGWGPWENRDIVIAGVCLLLALAAIRVCRGYRRKLALCVVLWMCACAALQVRRDQTRQQAFAHSFALHASLRFWVAALPYIDAQGESHRIAVTGGPLQDSNKWFQYFLFGRRFQNRVHYVPPTHDGGIAHFGPFGDLDARADEASWRKRLRAAQISEVMTFAPRSLEQGWMDAAPGAFEKLAGAKGWGLYRVKL
jgi:hypothetical protein